MSASSKTVKPSADKDKRKTQEQIVAGFNHLRQEQKAIIGKLSDLELELNEHSLVIDVLNKVDADRKCYRMVGGILVERTVKEVVPAVSHNKEQLARVIDILNNQVELKGREINDYKEKHNIEIQRPPSAVIPMQNIEAEAMGDAPASSSVLVQSDPS